LSIIKLPFPIRPNVEPNLRKMKSLLFRSTLALVVGVLLSAHVPRVPVGQTTIKLVVTGLRNDRGTCRFAIWDSPDGYPREDDRAWKLRDAPIEDGRSEWVIRGAPKGYYAVAFHHDENNDKEMNDTWYGMPEEGYGASNDATGTMSAPDWEDAKFYVHGKRVVAHMTAEYK
jgi:uncharacterized protein (DUF2141 family)